MTSTDGTSFKGSIKKYLAWKYNYLKDPKDINWVTCSFCENEIKGGIFLSKQHQIGKKKKKKRKCCKIFKMFGWSKKRT